MRITDRILTQHYLTNQNANKKNIDRLQRQIVSNSKINKPSDDPPGAAKSMRLSDQIYNNDVYQKNIQNAFSFLQETENSLNSIHDEIAKFLEMVPTFRDPIYYDNLEQFSLKTDLMLEQILNLANKEFDGKYLFGGTDFSNPPFGYADVPVPPQSRTIEMKTTSISGKHIINISPALKQQINITGEELFGPIGTSDIFNTFVRISDSFRNGELPSDDDLKIIQDFNKHLLNKTAKTGDIVNQLNATDEVLQNHSLELKSLLSKVKDVDLGEAVLELQTYQYNLDISYKLSSMILPQSLIDYL